MTVTMHLQKSVSEDEAAIQGLPRSRFGLLFLPPTPILKVDAALGNVGIRALGDA